MEEYSTLPWYFDADYVPSCSSYWEGFICSGRPNCLFSHNAPQYKANVSMLSEASSTLSELFFYISNYALINLPGSEHFQPVESAEFANFDIEKAAEELEKLGIDCEKIREEGIYQEKRMQERNNTAKCQCCKGDFGNCDKEPCKIAGKCVECQD